LTDQIGTDQFQRIQNATPGADDLFERPVLPLRELVVFPKTITPVHIPEGKALNAARFALGANQTILGVPIRSQNVLEPNPDDLYTIGTEMALSSTIPFSDGIHTALAQGRQRIQIVDVVQTDPCIIVKARLLPTQADDEDEISILKETLEDRFSRAAELSDFVLTDVIDLGKQYESPADYADIVASTLNLSFEERFDLLGTTDLPERLKKVIQFTTKELHRLQIHDELDEQMQDEINYHQREMYLREQMRIIQTELGESDIYMQDITALHEQLEQAALPDEVQEVAQKELTRLQMMPPIAPEVGTIRTYLDWIINLPWGKYSDDNLDVTRAQKILDERHYGLAKVKDRILEHIAVRKLAGEKLKTPILCFVGPPGVGKTSLGRSIATSLGREFVRVSLGGVRDEAEIRGHRRTYIGALPGRIIQTIRKAGTSNPVFMLDEIDKLGVDFQGDPAAALLEALDPEQNREYSDHYVELAYDLSKVMFITTANDLYPIPPALLDRMEVIEFPGYTDYDKLEIARAYLIPEQLEAHGIEERGIRFESKALQTIIREYTYEAGVRNFNRELASICRKVARLIAEDKKYPKRITPKKVGDYLGPPQFLESPANDVDSIGLATGLAWTADGGDILTIEVSLLPGKGTLTLTGQLGDVMQESAQAALSYMRSRAADFDVPHDDFDNYDVHIHLPEGSIPKDGPSAGITLACAIISVFTERPIRSDYAMTGEITLRGRVLGIGGIKEKLLAAHRTRRKNVILPEQNKKDLVDVPSNILRTLNIHFVKTMDEVIDAVLLPPPTDGRKRDLEHENSDQTDED